MIAGLPPWAMRQGAYRGLSRCWPAPLPNPELEVEYRPGVPCNCCIPPAPPATPRPLCPPTAATVCRRHCLRFLGLTKTTVLYTGLSLTHANAQVVTLGMILHAGMRGVISLKFTKSRLWDITREYGCTFFNLLGGMTTAIYAEPPRDMTMPTTRCA